MPIEYILSVADLTKKAAQRLGPMDRGTFLSYTEMAGRIAAEKGITSPVLVIGFIFKKDAPTQTREHAYPIRAEEWDPFLSEVSTLCEGMPDVFLVDRDKYALVI